ncbi:hypothetical protein [Stackebrandtia nassauensis]|uniref:Uncharacterized protein n=1 Tax=Stackebrandtia nassauensis (strain DSM 44728 / CIP 108903 / NRRL B-16338 / NBRC 102104 / LLR-40K-21) TaxID=446470 RepID=D3Q9K8_STANL|nr:hypothetical protein [Stackebrandtia nassauensis]ADD44554.1 hypothetical protein Snas_4913 [Stackebrandtia nassauensis DSM 44728]
MGDELQSKVDGILNQIPQYSSGDVESWAEKVKSAAKAKNGTTDYPYPDEYFEWIVPYFERFHQRMPSTAEAMVIELGVVREKILSAAPIIKAGTDKALTNWEGYAANSFTNFYIGAFTASPSCIDAQVAVIDELRAALWVYIGILKSMRSEAVEIAKATIATFESWDEWLWFGSDGQFLAGIAGAVATLFGVITATATAGVSLAIIGGAASASNAFIAKHRADEEASKKTIGGDTVADVLNNMADRLNELDTRCTDAEDAIATDLSSSVEAVGKILASDNATTLMRLVPNEIGDDNPLDAGQPGNTDTTDVTDPKDNPIPEFRPTAE